MPLLNQGHIQMTTYAITKKAIDRINRDFLQLYKEIGRDIKIKEDSVPVSVNGNGTLVLN